MKKFVILTYWNTIISVNFNGDIIHSCVRDSSFNLVFDVNGNVISSPSKISIDIEILLKKIDYKDVYVIEKENKFLSADDNGYVRWQLKCDKWEHYKLVSLDSIEKYMKPNKYISFPYKRKTSNIEKIIHQTSNEKNIPEKFIDNVNNIKKINNDYEYRYWSEQDRHDFIYDFFGWDILKIYLSINPRYGACRADFFRYLCIYQYGGVYLDIKSGCRMPIDKFICRDDEYIIGQWPSERIGRHHEIKHVTGGEFQQWNIISCAGHPFLEKVIIQVIDNINSYNPKKFGVSKQGALRVTGPIAYTLAIYPIIKNFNHRIICRNSPFIYRVSNEKNINFMHYSSQFLPIVL